MRSFISLHEQAGYHKYWSIQSFYFTALQSIQRASNEQLCFIICAINNTILTSEYTHHVINNRLSCRNLVKPFVWQRNAKSIAFTKSPSTRRVKILFTLKEKDVTIENSPGLVDKPNLFSIRVSSSCFISTRFP